MMDPFAPPQDPHIPVWLWKLAGWIVAGVFTLLTTILGWLGKRHVQVRDERIGAMKERMDEQSEKIEEMRQRLAGDHKVVNGGLEELHRKLDKIESRL